MAFLFLLCAILFAAPAHSQLAHYYGNEVTVGGPTGGGVVEFRDRTSLALLHSCSMPERTFIGPSPILPYVRCDHEGSSVSIYYLDDKVVLTARAQPDHAVFMGENGYGSPTAIDFKTDYDVLGESTACFSAHELALPTFPPQEPPFTIRMHWTTQDAGINDRIRSIAGTIQSGDGANPTPIINTTIGGWNYHSGYANRTYPAHYNLFVQDFAVHRWGGSLPAHPWCRYGYSPRVRVGWNSEVTGATSVLTADIRLVGLKGPQPHMDE
jgi:hypothetical protein